MLFEYMYKIKIKLMHFLMWLRRLTVSFGAVLQVEGEGQAGIILKEFGGKSIPPQIVTLLNREQGNYNWRDQSV